MTGWKSATSPITDDNLRYALLSDYSDAPGPTMPEDAERLGRRHARHRTAQLPNTLRPASCCSTVSARWSETEGRWMGWERKRGKLEQMNAFLMKFRGRGQGVRGTGEPIANLQPPPPMLIRAGNEEWLLGHSIRDHPRRRYPIAPRHGPPSRGNAGASAQSAGR